MKETRWETVLGSLRKKVPARPLRAKDDFWSDFAARARLTPQTADVPEVSGGVAALWMRTAAGAAAMALAVAVLVWPHSHGAGGSSVKSIEVLVPHSAVFILESVAGKGTIVWISDMGPSQDAGG